MPIIDDEWGYQFRLRGPRHQFDKSRGRVEDVRVGPTDEHAAALADRRQPFGEHLQDQPGDPARFQIQPEAEERPGVAGLRDLISHRHIDGERDHVSRVILEDIRSDHDALSALRHDAQGGLLQAVRDLRVRS